MILYNSNYFGLPQLTTVSGSAVYRTILPCLFSTCVFFVYKFSFGEGDCAQDIRQDINEARYTVHPFVITIYIMAFSLIVNHRLNYCYQRYWESCSNIFMMSSKWIDSATLLAAFHYQSIVYEEDRPRSFGDEDKPLDQLKDKDKKKSAPTGGNTRTSMLNSEAEGLGPMDDFMGDGNPNDDDNGSLFYNIPTSASDTSDSASSSSASRELSSVFDVPASAAADSIMSESRRGFVSTDSRERHRRYSEGEHLSRANRKIQNSEGRTEDPPNVLRQMFPWKILSKRKKEGKQNLSDLNEEDSPSTANSNRDSAILNVDTITNMPKPSQSVNRRSFFLKRPSMLASQLRTRGDENFLKSATEHETKMSQSERPPGRDPTKRPMPVDKKYHRRLPSTDIPAPGVGGIVVKSFKPNPSLDWQKRNRTAMPKNTGLHSTVFQTPIGLDFEKLLLEEEKERKEEARKKQLEILKHRQRELQHEKQTGTIGEGFFRSTRRRYSTPLNKTFSLHGVRLERSLIRALSANNLTRISNDATLTSVSNLSKSVYDDDTTKNSRQCNEIADTLRLYDLPSIHKKHIADNPKNLFPSEQSSKKPKSKIASGSIPFPFHASGTQNRNNSPAGTNGGERQSSMFRPPVEKMNGRASLFLQEAAHLYSLMSAVAMASLRADMEGVSSPLVDYVPGQKFPPVNPEEMKIKIFVTTENLKKDSKYAPSDDGAIRNSGRMDDLSTKVDSHNVRIMRNKKFSNILMFLFGKSRNSRQRTIYNASRPFSVLGGISDAEVKMLRKVRGYSAQHALCSLWLQEFITREHLDGSTGGVAPPIVARVYQHLTDGTQQYNNCRKTAFTDFPFPHAQLTSFFAFVSSFLFPLLYYTYVNNTFIALLLNFFTLSCFLGIQEVALELEQPFIRYPNDLPLNNYQAQFNEALISSLYGGFHPDAWGDAVGNEETVNKNYKHGGDDTYEIKKSRPSETSSTDLGGGKKFIPVDVQDDIEDSSASAGSRNAMTSTDDRCRIRNSSSISFTGAIKTKIPKRQNRNSQVHFSIPEGSSDL